MADLNVARAVTRMTRGRRILRQQDLAANVAAEAKVQRMRGRVTRALEPNDFRIVAERYSLPPGVLHVLAEKEASKAGGFAKDGRMTIMADPVRFSHLTGHAYDGKHAAISFPAYVPQRAIDKLPAAFVKEWGRHPFDLLPADRWKLWGRQATCNFAAAVQSMNAGSFLVPLLQWRRMGYEDEMSMLAALYDSEANHLDLLCRHLDCEDMLPAARRADWEALALHFGRGNREAFAADCRARLAKRSARLYDTA